MQINLTAELSRLVSYTAIVARKIRMYSAYNPQGFRLENAPYDIMWLSDSLHNFSMLGNAVLRENPSEILRACDDLLSMYQGYLDDQPTSDSFKREGVRVDLNEAMSVFSDIRAKVLPLV